VRKHLHRYLPTPESILAKPWCAPFRPWLGHPSLWHINRRSVAGAVAIGMFCGLIPGPVQMLSALILAIPLRKNIPLALGVTLYTNPFTIVPLYMISYGYGRLFVAGGDLPQGFMPDAWNPSALWEWTLSLGKPLALGLVLLALTLALAGYVIAALAWRLHVVRAWRRRGRERKGGLRAARTSAPRERPDRDRG
jgi:uncharacterized protein (DUF2062 family)